MSTFWLIYWITVGFIILLTLVIYSSFTLDKEGEKRIPFAYALICDMVGFVPGLNFLLIIFIIAALIGGIINEDIHAKF